MLRQHRPANRTSASRIRLAHTKLQDHAAHAVMGVASVEINPSETFFSVLENTFSVGFHDPRVGRKAKAARIVPCGVYVAWHKRGRAIDIAQA